MPSRSSGEIANVEPQRRSRGLTFMEFTDERDSGLDHANTDDVSAWIRMLAIAMIVIFVVFATLEWCDLLPSLPAATVAGTA